jgi:hybrid polyketide synthase/nonribosomal peptide synthetase ACE1
MLVRSYCPTFLATNAVRRIDNVVHAHGENIALHDGVGNQVLYKHMADRVNAIADTLISVEEVRAGSLIAVFQEPTADLICSKPTIMLVGAVYVPLNLR